MPESLPFYGLSLPNLGACATVLQPVIMPVGRLGYILLVALLLQRLVPRALYYWLLFYQYPFLVSLRWTYSLRHFRALSTSVPLGQDDIVSLNLFIRVPFTKRIVSLDF